MNLLLSTVRKTLSGKLLIISLATASAYLLLPGVILNSRFLLDTLLSSASIGYKLSISWQILLGYIEMARGLELVFLCLTAILLGMNISLLVDSISHLRQAKRLSFSIGGATIVALTASGCASCGVSLLSVLGISSSLLAIHNLGLYVFSCALLTLSLIFTARTHEKVCRLH